MDINDFEGIKHHCSLVLLITEDGRMLGQQRDNKPDIDSPGRVGIFGGSVDENETPLHAAWRELVLEETNLKFEEKDLTLFLEDKAWRQLTSEWEVRHIYYVKITDEQLSNLEIYEGQGWAVIKGTQDPMLAEIIRPAIKYFTENSLKESWLQ